jgi:hypothetical protein
MATLRTAHLSASSLRSSHLLRPTCCSLFREHHCFIAWCVQKVITVTSVLTPDLSIGPAVFLRLRNANNSCGDIGYGVLGALQCCQPGYVASGRRLSAGWWETMAGAILGTGREICRNSLPVWFSACDSYFWLTSTGPVSVLFSQYSFSLITTFRQVAFFIEYSCVYAPGQTLH